MFYNIYPLFNANHISSSKKKAVDFFKIVVFVSNISPYSNTLLFVV